MHTIVKSEMRFGPSSGADRPLLDGCFDLIAFGPRLSRSLPLVQPLPTLLDDEPFYLKTKTSTGPAEFDSVLEELSTADQQGKIPCPIPKMCAVTM